MPFPVAAAIGAGVSALGNIFSGQSNAKQAERNYRHRYQWEVQDLKKAGLNPALAYGHNAPIPQTQPLEPLGDSATKGASSAQGIKQSAMQMELTKNQSDLLKAQSADLIESAKLKNALLLSQTYATGASAGLTMKEQEIAEQTLSGLVQDNRWKEGTLDQRIALAKKQLDLAGVQLETAKVEKLIKRLSVPGARAEAQLFDTVGAGGTSNAIQLIKLLLGALK